ncbi:MAG: 16S rRNA (uracil(1498)-N(3))-methyltransferase [Pseudomonadota bacterium]
MKGRPGRMPRLYVEAKLQQGAGLALPPEAAHHAARVLRLREGDAVLLFDGRGGEYGARLRMPGRGQVIAEIDARRETERESPLAVTLAQGVSSGEKMDFTIQKAVELGVAAVQPLLAEKSVVRLSGERAAKRLAHWRRVAIAACEQCGRNRLPEIREPKSPGVYCRTADALSMRILLSPEGDRSLRDRMPGPGQKVILAVGPEAGFSSEEEALLVAAGFAKVRLGPRVLRTETAALAALAALNALAGDF